jgi:hypothetical protein
MKNASISALCRRAGRVLSRHAPGRDAAVIMSRARYDQMEESLRRLGKLEQRDVAGRAPSAPAD